MRSAVDPDIFGAMAHWANDECDRDEKSLWNRTAALNSDDHPLPGVAMIAGLCITAWAIANIVALALCKAAAQGDEMPIEIGV